MVLTFNNEMNPLKIPYVPETRFSEFLIRQNSLDECGFERWVFCPGMLFSSQDKWWGDQGKRDRLHEGLDFCLYRDQRNRIFSLDEKTKIPAMYDGTVVGIIDDFIGKSVILEHDLYDSDNSRFCTIYGHTDLIEGLFICKTVRQGDVIANLACWKELKSNPLPHLHISLGWASESLSYDQLDWKAIGDPGTLTLLNPLDVIDAHRTNVEIRNIRL